MFVRFSSNLPDSAAYRSTLIELMDESGQLSLHEIQLKGVLSALGNHTHLKFSAKTRWDEMVAHPMLDQNRANATRKWCLHMLATYSNLTDDF
jgi:hypothetical protein